MAYAEIKEGDPAEVRDLLAVRGMLKEAWTFSFDQAIRAATRAKVPDFRRMVLFLNMSVPSPAQWPMKPGLSSSTSTI
ncbi:hypothetical protein QW131_07205 [Roseibium salinum]|nr:hypothetical protein [Roseibium salinum]